MTKSALTIAGMLARALAVGAELQRIAEDPGLRRLSADAWRQQSLKLGDFPDVDALEAVRAKLEGTPYLKREIQLRGELFMRNNQDRPACWGGFEVGHGDMAAPYAERIMSAITPEQASAVACWHVAEQAPPEHWGRLDSFEQLAGMLEPLHRELGHLDQQLAAEVRLADLGWERGKPVVVAAGRTVVVDEGSASRLASSMAETAGQGLAIAA